MRFFVVMSGAMSYFKDEADSKPIKKMSLKGAQVEEEKSLKNESKFCVTYIDDDSKGTLTTLHLMAKTDAELSAWVDAIRLCLLAK
jgi:hypothetical protein